MTSVSNYIKCKRCGTSIHKDLVICTKCGKKNRNKWFYVKIFVGGWVVLSVVAAIYGTDEESTVSVDATQLHEKAKDNNATSQTVPLPPEQQNFVNIIEKRRDEFLTAKNEIIESEARERRARDLRSVFASRHIKGWIGKVYNIETTTDGMVIFDLIIPETEIHIGTWNNMVSDLLDNTIIKKNTSVYESIKSLKKGDTVFFRGGFLNNDTDHFNESSMTIRGSMTAPDYVFKFSSISTTRF